MSDGSTEPAPVVRPRAAVVLVHAAAPDSVLLLRRADDPRDPWSGQWCLPGGRRGRDDSDLLDTALRELREESGLVLPRTSLIRELPVGRAGPRERHVLVAGFLVEVETSLPTVLAAEIAESTWLPTSDLRDAARHGLRPVAGRPPEEPVPSFELGRTPLWGFTYRLLCEWQGLP